MQERSGSIGVCGERLFGPSCSGAVKVSQARKRLPPRRSAALLESSTDQVTLGSGFAMMSVPPSKG